jgi:uncharacterized protein (TIGR02300 family)
MPKEEWGVKRLCPTTGKRFYDMGRNPIVSPYTGDVVTLDTGKASRVLVKEPKAPVKEKKVDEDLIEDESVLDDDDDTADVDLDDDVLDDDEDDNVSLDDIADVASDNDDDN